MTAATTAERVRRHRERRREAEAAATVQEPKADPALAAMLATQAAILDALEAHRQALEALPQAIAEAVAVTFRDVTLRNDGGQPAQNGGQLVLPGGKNGHERYSPLRNDVKRRGRADARVYAGEEPNPPTGVVGPPTLPRNETIDTDDDDQRVLQALVARGSAASVRDATGLPMPRAVGSLVRLQVRGLVSREAGQGLYPDRWTRTTEGPPPVLEPLASVPLVLDLDTRSHHVTCSDYPGHATTHRWVEALEAFVCESCNPQAVDGPPRPSAAATQASGPASTVTH